jgi:LRR receptor-like serine/threonine-protein kinase FLS2
MKVDKCLTFFDYTAKLYLKFNLLSGTVLSTIGSLTKLGESCLPVHVFVSCCVHAYLTFRFTISYVVTEELHLNENSFTSTIPSELGALTSVKRLLLGDNTLSGAIPTELFLLTGMTVFFLNENSLTGTIPNGIGGLTTLLELSLRDNKLSGTIPSGIHENLTNLKTLFLQNNNLTGPFTCPATITNCKVSCEHDDEACRSL